MTNDRDERDITPEKIHVTWRDVDHFVTKLGAKFNMVEQFNGVYGPARGGLIFAVMISHRYGLPFLGAPQKGCLIVDDIVDTGDTARAWANKGYTIASMFYNKKNAAPVDYYMFDNYNRWVVFPWEEAQV